MGWFRRRIDARTALTSSRTFAFLNLFYPVIESPDLYAASIPSWF
jgi:hypothetical protein